MWSKDLTQRTWFEGKIKVNYDLEERYSSEPRDAKERCLLSSDSYAILLEMNKDAQRREHISKTCPPDFRTQDKSPKMMEMNQKHDTPRYVSRPCPFNADRIGNSRRAGTDKIYPLSCHRPPFAVVSQGRLMPF